MAGITSTASRTDPWAWTMARTVAVVSGAFCLMNALGSISSADSRVWSLIQLGVVLGYAMGLVTFAHRPMQATLALCATSLVAALAFFWFPPFYLVPIAIWFGSLTTLKARRAGASRTST
jgi:hypothetical protein